MSTCQNPSCRELPTVSRSLPATNSGPKAWDFDPESLVRADGDGPWTLKITVRFLKNSIDYKEEKREVVLASIKKDLAEKVPGRETWEHYANVIFEEATTGDADIRIGFDKRDGSWSRIGQQANEYPKEITLNLGDIESRMPPEPDIFGTILHEFGHALGLLHEHQSPLRGSNVTRKIERQSSAYVRRVGNERLVEEQMINMVDQGSIANLSSFDADSIMMYQIDGVTNKPNTKLSKLDKAFVMLNYPPDLTDYNDDATKKRLARFMTAIRDAGLESKGGELLDAFKNPVSALNLPSGETPTISHRFQAVRKCFTKYNKAMYLRRSNVNISNSVNVSAIKQYSLSLRDPPFGLTDPALARQYGLTDPVGDVVKNKFFQSLVKNIVKNTLEKRRIPTEQSNPGASPTEVARMIAAISSHEQIANYVQAYKDEFQGSKSALGTAKDGAEETVVTPNTLLCVTDST